MTVSAAAGTTHPCWSVGGRTIKIDKPVLMGIVNVTPDSFSDGGVSFSADRAIARALDLLEQGADVLDLGGESTRPGATPVAIEEELRRVIPVIEGILSLVPDALISIDTVKAAVAAHALEAGAVIVNDVSAHRLDADMGRVCARGRCGVILMHSRGSVGEMASYAMASYRTDVVGDVMRELAESGERAAAAGVDRSRIVLDPGFGFSKTSEHSLALLRELDRVCTLGFPVMAGLSRKRLIGEMSGISNPAGRDAASVVAAVVALTRGASLFRVHDVRAHRAALDIAANFIAPAGRSGDPPAASAARG